MQRWDGGDSRSGDRFSSFGSRGRGRDNSWSGNSGRGGGESQVPRNDRRSPWERGDDGTVAIEVEESVVAELLADREKAKRRKEFDEADRLRDLLLREHMIHVDDRCSLLVHTPWQDPMRGWLH